MRLLLSAIVAAGSLILAIAAFAQSATTTPAATVPVNPASAAPVASGKRFACKTASQGMRGQEQRDQMQLCMAQALIDCQEGPEAASVRHMSCRRRPRCKVAWS